MDPKSGLWMRLTPHGAGELRRKWFCLCMPFMDKGRRLWIRNAVYG